MLNTNKLYLIFILIFINICNYAKCFNVEFREFQGAKIEPFNTQIYKRELTQFFDKASYSFNGFEKIESVPVLFPIDICVLNLEGVKYATALHMNKDGVRHFAVFKFQDNDYKPLTDIPTPNATAMDCKAIGAKGYVAIAVNVTTRVENAKRGSPIYEIAGDRLRAVQYFPAVNLASVYLRVTGNDLFLLQTFRSTEATPNLDCPYFKWSGSTFNRLGRIPCSNARHLEPFSIDYENYVAVANYADQRGRTATNSEIYKFVREKNSFQLLQRIRTNGAVDVRYFSVPFDEAKKQHFLIFGNSVSGEHVNVAEGKNLQADSVFYVFEKGQFVPYQRLSLYAVEQFLPVQNVDAEKFLLLVACSNQDTKIYNLNDWKFEESEAQFTEGAFGKGVANMRSYREDDNSYLVIANELMTDNDTNIFRPIFKQDEHANALRQQIIEWAKTNIDRLAKIDMQRLKADVKKKLQNFPKSKIPTEIKNLPKSNIQTVITKSLIYPRLLLTSTYWKALNLADQALDALEIELKSKARHKRDVRKSHENAAYTLQHINVNKLVINNKLKVQNINGLNTTKKLKFDSITAKQIKINDAPKTSTRAERMVLESTPKEHIATDEINTVMHIKNLNISGKLNEFRWSKLYNDTLKNVAEIQFIKAPVNIGNVLTETVLISNDEVSGVNLAKLVSINGGDYVVDCDIKFTESIIAREIIINERLNDIHVHQRKFNVLLRKSNETQVVEGLKNFENIKVLTPITIKGKSTDRKMRTVTPNKAIQGDLILTGDYTITGDVIINGQLSTNDIIDMHSNISIKNLLANAISLDEPLDDVNINFKQPIVVNNSLISFINAQDFQQLVKTNIDEIQVVEAEKIFKKSLDIRKGFSEVKFLNGIDIEKLEQSLLLKHAEQTIKVPMHFGKIIAKGIHAPVLNLNNKNLSAYLTKSDNQHINGTLKVDKLFVDTMYLQNLNTNGKIFNEQLSDIYQQKVKSAPKPEIFQKNRQFHGTIYVKNLKLNNGSINGKPAPELVHQLQLLNDNIKYVGNFQLNYDMNITNLTFHGKFNGIPAIEFGKCWLQKSGAQSFLAPQTLSTVNCEKGVMLDGKLNGLNMNELYANTYWINRDEHINSAIFQNPLQMQGALITNSLNNLQIPQDILYRSSSQPQVLHAPISIQQQLSVKGTIYNTTTLNGLNLLAFERYLNGYGYDTLHMEHANFAYAPNYRTFNGRDLKQTLDAVWLANENIDLQQHVEMSDAHFVGLLEFEGSINNMNMQYLKQNYFSISRPQAIDTELMFANDVLFQNNFNSDDLHVFGPIIESKSNLQFDFNKFVANTLKTDGPHEIRATWSLLEAVVQGDLNQVRINNLDMAQDVLRANTATEITEITAPKHISSAIINKLYVAPGSTVNGVDMARWINDAVYVYENYTIQGVTTLDTVNLYNDLQVLGSVNNVSKFDGQTLLLRDVAQHIQGDVHVHNKLLNEQRILVSNFENLQAEAVNGQNVAQFYANRVKYSPNAQVHGHLVFTQPLLVEEYRNSLAGDVKWKRGTSSSANATDWQKLENSVWALRKSLEASHYVLDHFEMRQTIPLKASELISLPLSHEKGFQDVIGLIDETSNDNFKFYRWEAETQQYISDAALSWLPQEKTMIDILKLALDNANFLSVKKSHENINHQHAIISNETIGLQEVMELKNQNAGHIIGIKIQNEDCFAVYGNASKEVAIYCLQLEKMQQQTIPRLMIYRKTVLPKSNVKQILPLSNSTIALLLAEVVEIWSTANDTLQMVQRLPMLHPKQMTIGFRDGVTYLAVISDIKPSTLHHGAIEIYSSRNASYFKHLQTLDCNEPLQIAFADIMQSDDLLLNILTATTDQPLIIYQFKGMASFEKIVGTTTLPVAKRLHMIELKASKQHLIALLGKHEITFVEIMLKKI